MKYKNNPLNIRAGQDWLGLETVNKGFCEFYTLDYGLRAAFCILRTYQIRGKLTLHDVIYTWAPPSENNSHSYLSFVADKTLFPSDWKLDVYSPVSVFRLISSMCLFESQFTLGYESFDKGYKLFAFDGYFSPKDCFNL